MWSSATTSLVVGVVGVTEGGGVESTVVVAGAAKVVVLVVGGGGGGGGGAGGGVVVATGEPDRMKRATAQVRPPVSTTPTPTCVMAGSSSIERWLGDAIQSRTMSPAPKADTPTVSPAFHHGAERFAGKFGSCANRPVAARCSAHAWESEVSSGWVAKGAKPNSRRRASISCTRSEVAAAGSAYVTAPTVAARTADTRTDPRARRPGADLPLIESSGVTSEVGFGRGAWSL